MDIASNDAKDFNSKYHIYPNLPYVLMYRNGGRVSRYIQRSCANSTECMIPKIKTVEPLKDFVLHIVFDDGENVLYDVKDDIETLPEFKQLTEIQGLWEQLQLDSSRTCVYWNDRIDLASDTLYAYGISQSS